MVEFLPKHDAQPELPKHDPLRPLKASIKYIIIIFIAIVICFGLFRYFSSLYKKSSASAIETRNLMGTTVEIIAYGDRAKQLSKKAFRAMEDIATSLSIYNKNSEVSLINSMAGIAPVAVSPDTFDIISRSIILSKSLYGAFDISIGPLIDIWKINKNEEFMPPDVPTIVAARKLVNYWNIAINQEKETVKLKKRGMKLNLGAVGKGYVLSIGRSILVNNGIKSALISCGSTLTCIGKTHDGNLWSIGIKSPRDPEKILGKVSLLPGQAISTSGDYEQYIELNGKRYHHIIDPRTGYPASTCQAVTILAGDPTAADILSTAVFILGPWRGLRYLNSLENVEGLIIDSNGKIHMTAGFKLEKVDT